MKRKSLSAAMRPTEVRKFRCATYTRKSTDEGLEKLRVAGITHLRGVDELFVGRYSGSELATLAELLSRLPVTGNACKTPSCS